jgi:hypothetical protein
MSMFYKSIFDALSAHKIRYVVVGGVAVVLHGVVRLTADLDLAISLDPDNLKKFVEVMDELGFTPRAPVGVQEFVSPACRASWKKEKGMVAFTFYHPQKTIQQVDVFIEDIIPFADLERDAVTFDIFGINVKVVSFPHLKQLKLISGRPEDMADLEALDEIGGMNAAS